VDECASTANLHTSRFVIRKRNCDLIVLIIESICRAAGGGEAPVRERGVAVPPAPSCLRSTAAVDLPAKSLRQFAYKLAT